MRKSIFVILIIIMFFGISNNIINKINNMEYPYKFQIFLISKDSEYLNVLDNDDMRPIWYDRLTHDPIPTSRNINIYQQVYIPSFLNMMSTIFIGIFIIYFITKTRYRKTNDNKFMY